MRDLVDMEARMLFEPRLNVGMLVGGVVVADEMEVFVLRVSRLIWRKNSSHSVWRWRWAQREITEPSRVLIAANRVVVPCRL